MTWLERIFGCSHDWETIEGISESKLFARLEGDGPAVVSSRGNYFEHKVCLKCGKVVNEIADAERHYREQKFNKAMRQELAKELQAKHLKREVEAHWTGPPKDGS